jgi:hypothetical protein
VLSRSSISVIKKSTLIFQLYPHITRFSKVDLATGKLILSSLRPCRSGEQCFLNYGSLSNSHLLTFYGFILDKNPFDVVPIGMHCAKVNKHVLMLNNLTLIVL